MESVKEIRGKIGRTEETRKKKRYVGKIEGAEERKDIKTMEERKNNKEIRRRKETETTKRKRTRFS
jgi:hypothetical protein